MEMKNPNKIYTSIKKKGKNKNEWRETARRGQRKGEAVTEEKRRKDRRLKLCKRGRNDFPVFNQYKCYDLARIDELHLYSETTCKKDYNVYKLQNHKYRNIIY